MPPTCTVCTHEDRHQIDTELAAGTSSMAVSRTYSLSRHAVDRHRSPDRGHVPEAVLVEAYQRARAEAIVRPADVTTRLVDLAADVSVVRQRAAASGRDALVLRAVDTERALLADLVTRLGITTEAERQAQLQAAALVDAHFDLAREDPTLSRRLVTALRRQDAPAELVAAIEDMTAPQITIPTTEESAR